MMETSNKTIVLPEWVYYEQIVFAGIIALIGIPGNILIILMFVYSRTKITTDYLVFAMAVSDLLGSFISTTLYILQHVRLFWTQTNLFCQVNECLSMMTSVYSIWLLSITAFDRYMKTCRPHSDIFTIARAKWACVTVCAVVTTILVPSFAFGRFDLSSGTCLELLQGVWKTGLYVIAAVCYLSFLVTACAYIAVGFALYKRLKRKIKRRQYALSYSTGITTSSKLPVELPNDTCSNEKSSELNSAHADGNQVFVIETAQNDYGCKVNEKPKDKINVKPVMDEILRREHQAVNRTTIIMFLITAINSTTFILLFIGMNLARNNLHDPENLSFGIGYIIWQFFMANYIANPILYITMSSKFRKGVKELFKRR